MNKFFDVFAKGKRRKESISTLRCGDKVFDNHPRQMVFKNYQFDSDLCSTLTTDSTSKTVPERKKDFQNRSFESQEFSPSGPGKDCGPVPDKLSLLPGHEQQQCMSERNSRFNRQMYVIRISNSKNFHIGPQKTININSQWSGTNESGAVHTSAESKLILNRLLDWEEKLSEDYIAMISLHMEKKWKEFGRNLGLKETFLEEQEFRNGSNGILITYDMLHKYITQFPNTRLGFIIYVLSEIHCTQLIEKLAQKMKSNI